MQTDRRTILYVDDEAINLKLFELNFQDIYEVVTAQSAHKGLDVLREKLIDVIISDLKMPEMNGIDFIERVKSETPEKVCILLTAYIETDVMLKAINQELIFRYVTKPWKKADLQQIIDLAFDKFNSR